LARWRVIDPEAAVRFEQELALKVSLSGSDPQE
jgi:hypothetical protein